ncbi:hypothetical protein [Neobacillus sp. YIM B06451]|uniref:hypothetical protein n=1 Tax=Neobacillus sp. YIM B06451 TaxID=3070994 RepID=UPI00292FE319|nr:hypothetical protein [Neobacillus sp. YIM B06451]
MKKILMVLVLLCFVSPFNATAEASTSKVWWDGSELKPGQIGRVTIIKGAMLFKLEKNSYLSPVRQLNPGEVYRVYTTKVNRNIPLYGLGGGLYVAQEPGTTPGYLKYETPSKEKLALVNKPSSSSETQASIVMWDNAELKPGQIGRLIVMDGSPALLKVNEEGKKILVRYLEPGEAYRVYTYTDGVYGVGGGLIVGKNEPIKYETPSKEKLALANKK